MSTFNAEYRNVRPLFLSNNKLVCVDGNRSFTVFTKEYKPSRTISLPSSISSSASITCMHFIDGIAGDFWKMLIGTSEGYLFLWMKGKPLTLLHTFSACSISGISHIPGYYLAIALTDSNHKGIVKIFSLKNILGKVLCSYSFTSSIKEIHSQFISNKSNDSCQSFSVLSVTGNISIIFLEKESPKWKISPLSIFMSPKYKSVPTALLSILNSVLIIGFSNGSIALYLLKFIPSSSTVQPLVKSDLLTTLHWHSSPIKILGWERSSKSLFSGASEGVLCHWSSPLAPFLRSVSPELHSHTYKNELAVKYSRSTRPSSTLPGFGSSFEFISLSATGKMVLVTSDNSLRLLPTYSSVEPNTSSMILLHKNGIVFKRNEFSNFQSLHYPIQNTAKFPNLVIIPCIDGIQIVEEENSTCSHVLGSMPSGLPLVPGIPPLFKYSSSLVLSNNEIVVAMQSNAFVQLALWRRNISNNWIFISSADELLPGPVFLCGTIEGNSDGFILGSTTGQLSLWTVSKKEIQKKATLRRSTDSMKIVAMDLFSSFLVTIYTSCNRSWLSIYHLEHVNQNNESIVLKSTISIDSAYSFIRILSKDILVIGSEEASLISLYSFDDANTSIALCWTFCYPKKEENKDKRILLATLNDTLAIGVVPEGPIFTWSNGNKTPIPSSILIDKLPEDISSMILVSSNKAILRSKSGKITTVPEELNKLPQNTDDEDELDEERSQNLTTKELPSRIRMHLLVGKGPSSLSDIISELPSHGLPSPCSLLDKVISGIGLSLQAI